MKKLLVIFFIILIQENVFAQEIILKGKVVDSENNLSLAGVTVKVGSKGAITNKNGEFILNTQLKSLVESGINFSFVGYFSVRLIYQPNHFYQVRLIENTIQLNEVVVGAGEDIIKKAINKIPQNYPEKPIVIKGILRTQSWRNKSEYFKSDALIKAYIPSYTSNEKTTVSVLQNRLDTVYDRSLRYLKYKSNYNVAEFQDIVHNKYYLNQISKNKKFDYWLVGKQTYNNHKIFVINTSFKDSTINNDKINATFYIDTASYAFVAANIFRNNIKWSGVLPINILNYQVVYEELEKKWYLKETHCSADFVLKTQSPQMTVDFIRTEIDSINAEKIPYEDIIQGPDNILLIDKYNRELDWSTTAGLIQKAEKEGKMSLINTRLLDTIKKNNLLTNKPNQKQKKQFGIRVFEYLTNNNIRSSYGLIKSPFLINSSSFTVATPINYGLAFGFDTRVYKNLFLGFETFSNLWNSRKIDLSAIGLNLSHEIVFNKASRSIILRPHVGFQRITSSYQNTKVKSNSFIYGLRLSFEFTHKKAIFLSSAYNNSLKIVRINDLTYSPSPYTIGFGMVFK